MFIQSTLKGFHLELFSKKEIGKHSLRVPQKGQIIEHFRLVNKAWTYISCSCIAVSNKNFFKYMFILMWFSLLLFHNTGESKFANRCIS